MSRFEVSADLITLSLVAKSHYKASLDKVAKQIGLSADPFDRELNSERFFVEVYYCLLRQRWIENLLIEVNDANDRCVFECVIPSSEFELLSNPHRHIMYQIQESGHYA
ncbi:hypothetical protein THIAE_06100 [Thiomicrospira aerophila AL3]|uniref:Uncharacterized protein n=1 Tax=Thiomicrospira aerophila AL3 TaxID=717772 RepID=W0DZL7_9GAMM|nr:hypothetical protein [Thiomicrospira aerophila]AHF02291.1 hypothetical protein THIAE_06100 [Thiomicrospira aerophila AL3]